MICRSKNPIGLYSKRHCRRLGLNRFCAKSRRVKKVTPNATAVFFYDDWNLIEERIAYADGTTSTVKYYWGKDLSGSLQGAGGVGGLLYLTVDGVIYIPCYDNNGNITKYVDANGNVVTSYTYDAFGKLIAKSGALADFFRHRFSTKYFDVESGLFYYGYRFYNPILMRWLNRDPIEEKGGVNLYGFCGNNPIYNIDLIGKKVVVIKHLPGTKPESNWTYADSLAETHWRYPSYAVSERRCAQNKIGFTVDINPPTIIVHVYFRSLKDSIFEMYKEQQHIDAIVRYDDTLSKYKENVEQICECPDRAHTILAEESRKLTEAFYESESYHNRLDAPGGPHGH